jgi:hypothetical protein
MIEGWMLTQPINGGEGKLFLFPQHSSTLFWGRQHDKINLSNKLIWNLCKRKLNLIKIKKSHVLFDIFIVLSAEYLLGCAAVLPFSEKKMEAAGCIAKYFLDYTVSHPEDSLHGHNRDNLKYVRFEVFTVVTIKNAIFWDVMPCDSIRTDVSEKHISSNIRVKRIGELGALGVTSN